MPPTGSAQSALSPGRPDVLFALVAGLYASIVFVPLGIGLALPLLSSPAGVYVALVAGLATLTTVVAVSLRRTTVGLPEWLGADARRFLPAGVPLAVGLLSAGYVVGLEGHVPERLLVVGAVAAVGGFFLGALLGMMARTRYVRQVRRQVEIQAAWRAGWPEGPRRLVQYVGIGVLVVLVPTFVVGALLDNDAVR